MLNPRLIPTLLVDSNLHLVKTKSFKNRHYIGDPLNSAYIFSCFEADELVVLILMLVQKTKQFLMNLLKP